MIQSKDAEAVEGDLRRMMVGQVITNVELVAGDEDEPNRVEISCGERFVIMFAAHDDDLIVAGAMRMNRADLHELILQPQ